MPRVSASFVPQVCVPVYVIGGEDGVIGGGDQRALGKGAGRRSRTRQGSVIGGGDRACTGEASERTCGSLHSGRKMREEM
jgi:hypothetical protein